MKAAVTLGIMAIVGLTVGIALFSLTSSDPQTLYSFSTPLCDPAQTRIEDFGFDPLTGLPHGYTFECAGVAGVGGSSISHPPPAALAARRAIPVPVGFVLGAAAAGAVLFVRIRGAEPTG